MTLLIRPRVNSGSRRPRWLVGPKTISTLLGALCLVAAGLSSPGSGLPVAGMANWKIVCPPAAIESEKYAAKEFQTLFQEMTGCTLPLVETMPADSGAVLIGPDAVQQAAPGVKFPALGEEGLGIQIDARRICITGGRPRGTLYGVYDFFEEECGARFLTFDCTAFPPGAATRELRLGRRHWLPQFSFRWSYYGECNRRPDFAARLRVNTISDDPKLGGRTGYRLVSHNVAYLVPPEKFGKDHPEYYALVDGHRKLDQPGGGPQLCVSNPQLLEVMVKAVLAEIEKNPTARNINIAQMDQSDYCTCPNCAAIDAREESHAGANLAFVNAVAERVEKVHPEVLISAYAYDYTRKPPKTLRARHNVMIQLCSIECCDLHAIDDPKCSLNREFCEDMRIWKKKCDHIFIWHYNTNFRGYVLPFPNLRSIGQSVAYFAGNNGQGVFMQAAGNGFSTEFSDLRNYVMARCLWHPGRDSWKEAEEFCRLYYREAAGPILGWLDYYHRSAQAAGVHPTCFPTEGSLALTPETVQRGLRYFSEALALAQSDTVRSRVEKASLCIHRAALSITSMNLNFEGDLCRPNLQGFDPGLLDHYAALCSRFGVAMDDEMVSAERALEGWRQFHAGLKAIRLENETWRLRILPQSNGKVVEMLHKPSGRNVIQSARSLGRFRYEEWVRQGQGPKADQILPYEAQADANQARLSLVTPDGSRLERTITLSNEVIRFEATLTANTPRLFEALIHPEYDTATHSEDPSVLSIYVKQPGWVQANRGWRNALPQSGQNDLIRQSVSGGGFAYYNHQARFGVEQRYDPKEMGSLGLFWNPSRQQVNLELRSALVSLAQGQRGHYAFEVRYLQQPPTNP